MKRKKTIKKLLISFFLICILIIISIFLSGYYIINNYKPLLAKFGIVIKEDCKVSLSKISCNYIDISSKNFDLNLDNLNASIYLKNVFSNKKVLDLYIENVDVKVKTQKRKKRKAPTLKKLSKYSYNLLKRVSVNIKNININATNLKIKELSFKNSENKFSILKPFYIEYGSEKIKISSFEGFINSNSDKIVIERIYGSLQKLKFFFKGYYLLNDKGEFIGYVKGKFIKIKEFVLNNINFVFNLKIKNSEIKYIIKGDIKNIESSSLGILDNVALGLDGFFNDNIEFNLYFKFNTAYLFNEYFFKNFSLKGNLELNKKFTSYKGSFNLVSKEVENTIFKFKNITSNFSIENNDKAVVKGKLAIDKKIKLDFVSKIKTKKDLSIDVKNINGKIEDIILALKEKPNWLNSLKGEFLANLNYKIRKSIDLQTNIKNLSLFGVSFSDSFMKIIFNPKNLDFKAEGKLTDKNSYLNFFVQNKDKNLSGDLDYENIDISNLIWVKMAKIKTVLSGKGKIYGQLTNPKFDLFGKSKFFEYEKIYVPDIDYKFLYEDKKINIVATHKENIKSFIEIAFSPFNLSLNIIAKKAKGEYIQQFLNYLNPEVFAYIKPKEINGNLDINVFKKNFSINMHFENSKVLVSPTENVFIVNLKGNISKNSIILISNFGKKDFIYNNFHIKDIQGNFRLKNNKFSLYIFARNSNNLDGFFANLLVNMDIANNILNTNFALSGTKLGYHLAFSGNTKGEIKKFKGKINYVILKDNYLISSDKANIKVDLNNNIYAKIFSDLTQLNFKPKIKVYIESPRIEVFVGKNEKVVNFFSPHIRIYKSKVEILHLISPSAKFDGEKLIVNPFLHSGIFKGEIDTFKYWISSEKLQLKAKGQLNKEAISQIVQILSVDGNAQYTLDYNGSVDKFIYKAKLKLYSDSLKIKSTYVIGIINIKDLIAYLSNGTLNLKLSAYDDIALLSKGRIDLYATSYIKRKETYVYAEISNLPVKYLSLFKGSISSTLNLELKNLEGKLIGEILLAGSLKLNPSFFNRRASKNENINLEKIKLDIKISSYLPVYVYGNWGEAYAEIKGHLTGSLASPIFNGEITMIYGKISYMKNNFNIDFANIKITNNIPFLTAKLSTNVANTHIFINISGNPPDDLIFNFSSTPPRSREEIMAILLLRNTPNTLENIPVFSAFGRFVRSILPLDKFLFSGDAESTFFNTGFDINISPRYSPTQGVVATIYASRNITRRIYVALSKPLSPQTSQTLVGWYEGGFRLTETTSVFTRFYEDDTNEIGIIFNLQFDF